MQDGDTILSPDTRRKVRVPPGQKLTGNWPVLHYGDAPEIDVCRWTFEIAGLADNRKKLNFGEFSSLPRVQVFSDIHCVTGWSRLDNTWEGVSTRTIGDVAGVLPEAKYAIIHCVGGFTTNLTLEDFFAQDALFALKHNGTQLDRAHGYPVRLVVPRLYFWKSAKWVRGVEFTARDRKGFWESHGYHNHGDPWTEERYG